MLGEMIKNDVIWGKEGVASVVDKKSKARQRWFRLVKRRCEDAPVKRCEWLAVAGGNVIKAKSAKNVGFNKKGENGEKKQVYMFSPRLTIIKHE